MTIQYTTALPLEGLIEITPRCFSDSRGFFLESYKESTFVELGITQPFVQDNHSLSHRGVLRGIHFQRGDMAQGKLVRVVTGSVWDVAVDLRKGSPTFMRWYGTTLSAKNQKQLYIPRGFGHGFLTLEDETNLLYKCDNLYDQPSEAGIVFNDPLLEIKWPYLEGCEYILSDKDQALPLFKEVTL